MVHLVDGELFVVEKEPREISHVRSRREKFCREAMRESHQRKPHIESVANHADEPASSFHVHFIRRFLSDFHAHAGIPTKRPRRN